MGTKLISSFALAAAMLLALIGVDSSTPASANEDCVPTVYNNNSCDNRPCPTVGGIGFTYNWKTCPEATDVLMGSHISTEDVPAAPPAEPQNCCGGFNWKLHSMTDHPLSADL